MPAARTMIGGMYEINMLVFLSVRGFVSVEQVVPNLPVILVVRSPER
jgi:hypothetical protein